jgi:hypothetical protein
VLAVVIYIVWGLTLFILMGVNLKLYQLHGRALRRESVLIRGIQHLHADIEGCFVQGNSDATYARLAALLERTSSVKAVLDERQ